MNPSQPPTATSAAAVTQPDPSTQPPPTATTATTAPPIKKPSAQATIRPATDHHWYNKQVAPVAYPQSNTLNPPNPNSTGGGSNLQLQFPNQQGTQGNVFPVGTSASRGGLGAKNGNGSRPGTASNGGDRSAAYSLQQLGRPDSLSNQQMQFLKSGYLNHSHPVLAGGGSAALQGFPVNSYPKAGFSAATDRNGIREIRSKDETAVILNRKVRVSEGSSLYSLCRSWLKNGVHDQYQPKHATRYSHLPRPLPTPAQTPSQNSSEIKEAEEEDKEYQDEKSVELLSSDDLLQRHIKRAKRVRSRLREERLHRITRYKTRLATLLPSPVEPIRDETPAGN